MGGGNEGNWGGGDGEKMRQDTHVPRSHFPPLCGRRRPSHSVPITKQSIWYPDGAMGEIKSIHGYPKIRVPRRLDGRIDPESDSGPEDVNLCATARREELACHGGEDVDEMFAGD